jgi:NADH-quinone oxidoreductase subunit M
MNLLVLLLLPLLTAVVVLLMRNATQVKWVALAGAAAQFILAFLLFFAFRSERAAGNDAQMLFELQYNWFPAWHISFHLGVDGISVAMILLTSFVVIAGVLVSWNVEKMTKEFYFLLILLSLGAYGFFISLDLFILFFFLEIAVIPKYLLIGIWGSGKKEYAANKLALMLMGGSALVLVGLLGTYFGSPTKTFDLMTLSHLIPPLVCRLWCIHGLVSISYLGTGWSLLSANCGVYVPGRHFHETRWLWLFAGGYLHYA